MSRMRRDGLALTFGAVTVLSLPPWGVWLLAPVGIGLWLRFCNRRAERWRDRLEVAGPGAAAANAPGARNNEAGD